MKPEIKTGFVQGGCTSEHRNQMNMIMFISSCISMHFRLMGPCMDDSTTRPESTWSSTDSKRLPDEQQESTHFASFSSVTGVVPVFRNGAFTQQRKGPERPESPCRKQCDPNLLFGCPMKRNPKEHTKFVACSYKLTALQSERGPDALNQHATMDSNTTQRFVLFEY